MLTICSDVWNVKTVKCYEVQKNDPGAFAISLGNSFINLIFLIHSLLARHTYPRTASISSTNPNFLWIYLWSLKTSGIASLPVCSCYLNIWCSLSVKTMNSKEMNLNANYEKITKHYQFAVNHWWKTINITIHRILLKSKDLGGFPRNFQTFYCMMKNLLSINKFSGWLSHCW